MGETEREKLFPTCFAILADCVDVAAIFLARLLIRDAAGDVEAARERDSEITRDAKGAVEAERITAMARVSDAAVAALAFRTIAMARLNVFAVVDWAFSGLPVWRVVEAEPAD